MFSYIATFIAGMIIGVIFGVFMLSLLSNNWIDESESFGDDGPTFDGNPRHITFTEKDHDYEN